MHVQPHVQLESILYIRHRSCHVQVQAIARNTDYRKAIGFRETNRGIVVFLSGAEACGELIHGKVVAVRRAGGIVEFLEKVVQRCLITQRQDEHKAHGLCWGQTPDRPSLPILGNVADMAR